MSPRSREAKEKKYLEEKRKEFSYMDRPRDAGSGPRRIGEKLHFDEDLYSTLFLSSCKAEYIYHSKETHD